MDLIKRLFLLLFLHLFFPNRTVPMHVFLDELKLFHENEGNNKGLFSQVALNKKNTPIFRDYKQHQISF